MLPNYDMKIFQYTNSNDQIEWVVEFPDLKGCSAVGASPEEALQEAEIAKEIWLETYYEVHSKYPATTTHQTEYSGKLLLRMTKTLHKQLAEQAEEEGVSLNMLCNTILAEGFSEKQNSFTVNYNQPAQSGDSQQWTQVSQVKVIDFPA